MATSNAESKWLNDRANEIVIEILSPLGYSTNGFTGDPLFEDLKISRGYPPKFAIGARIRSVGVTLDPRVSNAGKTEIFISPFLDDSLEVLETLVHELGHAALGGVVGHGPDFKKYSDAVELEDGSNGVLDNHASQALRDKLQDIIDRSEPYPHEGLNLTEAEKLRASIKAATRMVKMVCKNDKCPGFVATRKRNISRATWTNIVNFGCDTCTSCSVVKTAILKKGSMTGGSDGQGTPDPNAPPVLVDGYGNGKPQALPPNVKVDTDDAEKGNKKQKAEGDTDSDEAADSSGDGDDDFDPDAEPEFDTFDPTLDTQEAETDNGPKSNDAGSGSGRSRRMAPVTKHPADPNCRAGANGSMCPACADEMAMMEDDES